MPRANGYCLKSPKGELLSFTFGNNRDECWTKSFDYLFANKKWMLPYWKKLEESIAAAKRHKFIMVRVHLSEVKS